MPRSKTQPHSAVEPASTGSAAFVVESPAFDWKTRDFKWVEVARYKTFKAAKATVDRNVPKVEMRIRGEWPPNKKLSCAAESERGKPGK